MSSCTPSNSSSSSNCSSCSRKREVSSRRRISSRVSILADTSLISECIRDCDQSHPQEAPTVRTFKFSLSSTISSACSAKSSSLSDCLPNDPPRLCRRLRLFGVVSSSPPSVNRPLALSPSLFRPIFSLPSPKSASTRPPRINLRRCLGSSDDGTVARNPRMSEGVSSCVLDVSRDMAVSWSTASSIASELDVARVGIPLSPAGKDVGRRRRAAGLGVGLSPRAEGPFCAAAMIRGCMRFGATTRSVEPQG